MKQKVHYMRNFILMAALMFVAAACNGVQNSSSEASAESGLQMSQMYTDGMVLQRDIPLVIKGKANAGERVSAAAAAGAAAGNFHFPGRYYRKSIYTSLAILKNGIRFLKNKVIKRKEGEIYAS